MKDYQQQAWDWLLPVEQNSLYLTLSNGKSSWEVGTILKISHYKYLEIRERSETLFKMFAKFLEEYYCLFRPDGPCQEDFKEYMEALICLRKSRKQAAKYTGISSNLLSEVSNKKILKNMNRLKNSDDQWDIDTYNLILEFDRWNNFRILPTELQRPSAYKRRINKKHKAHLKYLLELPKKKSWLLERIKERFYFKTPKASNKYYTVLIDREKYDEGYFVLPIKRDPENIEELTKFQLYVFENKIEADSYGFKVANYGIQTSQVKLGLKFWPEYRILIEKAINYKQLNNLEPN